MKINREHYANLIWRLNEMLCDLCDEPTHDSEVYNYLNRALSRCELITAGIIEPDLLEGVYDQ